MTQPEGVEGITVALELPFDARRDQPSRILWNAALHKCLCRIASQESVLTLRRKVGGTVFEIDGLDVLRKVEKLTELFSKSFHILLRMRLSRVPFLGCPPST